MRRRPVDLATLGGLGAILLWSTTFAFARSLSEQVGPLTGGAAAHLIAGVLCGLRLAAAPTLLGRIRRLSAWYLLGCGSLFVFYTAALYLAIGLAGSREQLLEIALLNYLWPALTVLLSLPLLNQQGRPSLVPGTVLALAGIFLVMTQDRHVSWGSFVEHLRGNPAAYALALAAAVSWALYSNLTRRWSVQGNAGAVELFIPATGLVLLGLRLLMPEPAAWSIRAASEATGLAIMTTVAYVLWDLSMRRGNLLLVVASSYFTPLLSTLVSCVYLGVSPGARLWIGCLLLVLGSMVTWRSVSEEKPTPTRGK